MTAKDDGVAPEDGCPLCGERDPDRLVWIDDDQVECQMCGSVYQPPISKEKPDEGEEWKQD